ncbi:MAG: hypothetical protein ABIJ09_06295 [Pseudomonadota bacterium]
MWRTRTAIALVTLASLLFEVTLTRVLSFTLWYHFAFLVVGVALLGSASAGTWLATRRASVDTVVTWRWALVLALALPVSHAAFQLIPFEPFRLALEPMQWVLGAFGVVVLAAPFFANGVILSSLLARAGERPYPVYAADLLGAGLGATLAPLVIGRVGAPGAIVVAAVLAGVAALLFAWVERGIARWLSAGVVFGLIVLLPTAHQVLPWRVSADKRIGGQSAEAVLRQERLVRWSGWDIASRVDVIATREGARILVDAGTAMTRVPRVPATLDHLTPIVDATAAVLQPARGQRVLIVGSGGGWEVLRALSHGAALVDAVEINPLVVRWVQQDLRDGAARLHQDPRVRLHLDEARAFLTAHDTRYRAILMVHTISNAAYGAGAMSLAEDYILTREAFVTLLAHLDDEGLLLVTRPDAQLARLVRTVQAALPGGVEVDHTGLAFVDPRGAGFFAGLITSRRALTPETRSRIEQLLTTLGLQVRVPSSLRAPSSRSITTPASDDQPFFSQRVRFSDLGLADLGAVLGGRSSDLDARGSQHAADGRMALEERPVAEIAAVGTGFIACLVGLLGVLLPLILARRTRRQLAAQPAAVVLRFVALGLAFLFVEIALMQKLTRVLGHPSLSFAVVLGALLVGTGLSSLLLAPRLATRLRPLRAALWIAAASAGLLAVSLSAVLGLVEAAPLAVRILAALLLCTGMGLAMGLPFPTALRDLAQQGGSVPWAFGVNGFASVAAPALALVAGAEFGLTATLLVGSLLYALCGVLPESTPPPRPDLSRAGGAES